MPAGPGLTYQQVAERVRLSGARRLRQLGQPLTEDGELCPDVRAAENYTQLLLHLCQTTCDP